MVDGRTSSPQLWHYNLPNLQTVSPTGPTNGGFLVTITVCFPKRAYYFCSLIAFAKGNNFGTSASSVSVNFGQSICAIAQITQTVSPPSKAIPFRYISLNRNR